jgi:hypothetical protein
VKSKNRGKDKVEREKGQGTRDRRQGEKDKVESSGEKSFLSIRSKVLADFSPEVKRKSNESWLPGSPLRGAVRRTEGLGGCPFGKLRAGGFWFLV